MVYIYEDSKFWLVGFNNFKKNKLHFIWDELFLIVIYNLVFKVAGKPFVQHRILYTLSTNMYQNWPFRYKHVPFEKVPPQWQLLYLYFWECMLHLFSVTVDFIFIIQNILLVYPFQIRSNMTSFQSYTLKYKGALNVPRSDAIEEAFLVPRSTIQSKLL